MLERMAGERGSAADDYGAALAIGRIAEPEEVAEAVLWLSSPRAWYVNGESLVLERRRLTVPDSFQPDTSGGRVALVTGATGPIGRAVAAELASSGFRVVITGRPPRPWPGSPGSSLVREADRPCPWPPTSPTRRPSPGSWRRSPASWAASTCWSTAPRRRGARPGPFLEKSRADLRAQVENNLLLPVLLSHAVLGGMVARGYGRIVAISSVAGLIRLRRPRSVSAAKAGLSGFVRQLAYEFGRSGVTANCLAPGPVATPNVRRLVEAGDPGLLAMLEQTPSGRLTTPEDIARAVRLLGSEAAATSTDRPSRWTAG